MSQRKKNTSHIPDPSAQKVAEERTRAVANQLQNTIDRVRKDFGLDEGGKMAEAVLSAAKDADFFEFLSIFYDGADFSLPGQDEVQMLKMNINNALLVYKMDHHLPFNKEGRIEEFLFVDPYILRFLREFFNDLRAAYGG